MDPLSITASIISVLQAINAVISVCYDYSAALKGAPWELSKVVDELRDLRDVLENLERVVKKTGNADPTTHSRLPTLKLLCDSMKGSESLVDCLEEVNRIRNKLSPPSWSGKDGSKRQALIQVLGWPLKEQDTRRSLETIDRFKSTLTLALTSDQASMLLAVQDTVENTARFTLGIHERFQLREIVDNGEKIYKWLSPPDPSVNLNDAYKKRHAQTGSWLLRSKQYLDWKTYPDSLLWLHGIPGCGKTVLSSTIVEDVLRQCRQDVHSAAAYFFFDFNDSEKQLSDRMIRSIVAQISQQLADMPTALTSLFSSSNNRQQPPTTDALLTMLQQMYQEFDDIYIILDALDECTDRLELLNVIEKIHRWKIGNLHFIVTSREEKDIQESLDSLTGKDKQLSIQSALVDDDIRAYIQDRLKTDRQLRRWQSRLVIQQEIENALMDRAAGMFRWAACQLDALSGCLTVPMLRKALKSLPTTLDDTYVRILCSINAEYYSYAFKILQWLAFSVRPLSIQEAAEILAIDGEASTGFNAEHRLEDPRDILTICSSLVTITIAKNSFNEDYEELRLAHYSVKEYLISDRVSQGLASRYDIAIEPDKSIAQICLLYLLYFSTPSLSSPDIWENFPLLEYAVENWTSHARNAEGYTNEVAQLSMKLLGSHKKHAFINWLSLHWQKRLCGFAEAPLYHAALEGLYRSTKLLLDTDAKVDAVGGPFGTALIAASSRGRHAVVELLIDAGGDVNAIGEYHGTALIAASHGDYHAIVRLLIDAGADVNAVEGPYGTALKAASSRGCHAIVELLIDAGADVNAMEGAYGAALQVASHGGYDAIVRLLIDAGADVNAVGGDDDTALRAASLYGHTAVVRLLIGAGADVNAVGVGRAALVEASVYGHTAVVQLLIDAGADVNAVGVDRAALVKASQRGHNQVDDGAIYADTALIKASFSGHDPVVERLLRAGAQVNTIGVSGPALRTAAFKGHVRVVGRLLKAGVQVNMKTTYGSALKVAAQEGYSGIVEQLLKAGADVNADEATYLNALPATTLEAAVMGGRFQVAERLIEAGAEVNRHTETYSRTSGYQHYIKRLLEAGAVGSSPAEPSSHEIYSDALHMATVGEEYDLILLLLEAGARVDKSSLRDHPRYAKLPSTTPELTVQRLIGIDLLEKYAINGRLRKLES